MRAQIGTRLKGGTPFEIDLQSLATTRLFIQGTSGSGKSYLLRKILEETHAVVQHFVIDPDGEFRTLRERFDYVLVGAGGDTTPDPATAERLALRLRELGASVILDLYELEREAQDEFVARFLEGLMRAPKSPERPALVVVDEVDKFAPNRSGSDAAKAVINVACRGRKRGYAIIPATQRISKVHKDVVAECLNKLIGLTDLDIDRKRVAEELGFETRAERDSLKRLQPGEFYAYGPALGRELALVRVGQVLTRHGSQIVLSKRETTNLSQIRGALAEFEPDAELEDLDEGTDAATPAEGSGIVIRIPPKARSQAAGRLLAAASPPPPRRGR
jgi:DNA helicase HerA-like ATPase